MGFLAEETGLEITKVVQEGQGLVFVVYPYAVNTIPVGPIWSVMFFVMMLALGMGTMV
jgi:SNF family Na+-dependent transporter